MNTHISNIPQNYTSQKSNPTKTLIIGHILINKLKENPAIVKILEENFIRNIHESPERGNWSLT